MLTFTQIENSLSATSPVIGNQHSDVEVTVKCIDDTFTRYGTLWLYIAGRPPAQPWAYEIKSGKAVIKHDALADRGDVFVSLAAYNDKGQITSNAVQMIVRESNDPSAGITSTEDWTANMAEALISAAVVNDALQARLAKALAQTDSMRDAAAKAGTEYAQAHGINVPAVVDNLSSTSGTAALSAAQGKALKDIINAADSTAQRGSGNLITSDAVAKAVSQALVMLATGRTFVRIGDLQICSTSGQTMTVGLGASTPGIRNARGGTYNGTAEFTNKSDTSDLKQAGFPCCFTSVPAMLVEPTGTGTASQTSWTGNARAEYAGPVSITWHNGASTTTNSGVTARLIAIGMCSGRRKQGAQVITEGLRYLGDDSIKTNIIGMYNSYLESGDGKAQNDGDAWCSEFASTMARLAGVSKDIFPMFASAYRGSLKFSDMGKWYKRQGSVFYQGDVAEASSTTWSDSITGSAAVMPEVGDVLFMSNSGNPNKPGHTGLVTSVSGTKIYTLEGNLNDTVERRCRDIGLSDGLAQYVYAFGKVDYPSVDSDGVRSDEKGVIDTIIARLSAVEQASDPEASNPKFGLSTMQGGM